MIEVAHLRREYGKLVAVDDVSFTAKPGSIFGLLGPNGAGKSTTIGCISGLLRPSAGTVTLLGQPVSKARQYLGIVPQELALYEDLSATDNVAFWASAYGLRGEDRMRSVKVALEAVGLSERATGPVKEFSGGMKRRLNFACGVVHRPKILLLDEPTAGVDPQSRVHLLDQVRAQAAAGATVLYTTHYMEEAQELCDPIAILDGGRIIAEGSLTQLRDMVGGQDVVRLSGRFEPVAVRAAAATLNGVEVVSADADCVILSARAASQRLSDVFQTLATTSAVIRETTLSQASLESLFIKLTGRELRE